MEEIDRERDRIFKSGLYSRKPMPLLVEEAKAHIAKLHPDNKTRTVSFQTAQRFMNSGLALEGKTFLDLGGSTGILAECLSKFMGANVISYEPFKLSAEGWIASGDVDLRKKAVTSDGREVLMSCSRSAIDSGYLCSAGIPQTSRKIGSSFFTHYSDSDAINDVLQSTLPDVVKIDIEGAEYEVIKEAKWPASVGYLNVEFHAPETDRWAPKFLECLILILESGFAPSLKFIYNARTDGLGGLKKIGFFREMGFSRSEMKLPAHRSFLERLSEQMAAEGKRA